MRIVFIVTQLTDGGAEREAAAFASELAQMGEEVHLICIHDRKDDYVLDKRVHRHLFRGTCLQIPKLKGALNIVSMAALLRKIRGDVVLPFYVPFHLAVLLSGSRLIYTVRCNLEKELLTRRERLKKRLICRFADGIWIQTEEQRIFFPKEQQDKLFEVHNILNPRFLCIEKEPRKEVTHFITVGRLHPQKNQKLLIDAFEKMLRRTGNKSATLTIYGQAHRDFGRTEEELKEQIRQLELKDRVFLAGRVADIEKRYAEADAFVFGSDYEGCPNALMEAMAAGLPCISTDCPTGPSLLITNGKNGLLTPVGDVEAMTRAMQYLIENPLETDRLGRAARQRMHEWGEPRELAKCLLDNLRRVCGKESALDKQT